MFLILPRAIMPTRLKNTSHRGVLLHLAVCGMCDEVLTKKNQSNFSLMGTRKLFQPISEPVFEFFAVKYTLTR